MKLARAMPKVLRAIAVLFIGPLLGILIAFLLAALSLRSDPNFLNNGGHAAPGDGFLAIIYALISLAASVPLSIWGALVILFRPSKATSLERPISFAPDDADLQ
jgi:hypothetical protein